MIIAHIIILAIIQGLTEFLPVSSSGHLAITHTIMGQEISNTTLLFDIAVHVGTLFSVVLYCRKDIFEMVKGTVFSQKTKNKNLTMHIIIASIPVIIAGLFIKKVYEINIIGSLELVGWMTLIFGIVLWGADRFSAQNKTLHDITHKNALFIGLFQILALIPGVSRSGITMTAARFVGVNAYDSAKFSLFLGIIAISGAGTLLGLDLLELGNIDLTYDILIAILFSFIAGWASIALMLKWLTHHGFGIFVLYRIVLGVILLTLF